MKIIDFFIIVLLSIWIIAALIYIIKNKKQGKNIGCGGCIYRDSCSKNLQKKCKKKEENRNDREC